MKRSDSIAQLADALAKAQGEIGGAVADSEGKIPQKNGDGQLGLRSYQYSDLESVTNACRGPLSKNGLSYVQIPHAEGSKVTLTTILMHKSGEFIESELTLIALDGTPQKVGSAITYARRYSLASIVGVAPTGDDDGDAASRVPEDRNLRHQKPPKQEPRKMEPVPQQAKDESALRALLIEIGCQNKDDAYQVVCHAAECSQLPKPESLNAAYADAVNSIAAIRMTLATMEASDAQGEVKTRAALLNDARSQQAVQ